MPNKGTTLSLKLCKLVKGEKLAKVILIDDHHIVRQGLEFLLSTVADLEVLASLSDGQSLINYLNENDIPDIILLDLVMPEMNGIEVTEYVKSHFLILKYWY